MSAYRKNVLVGITVIVSVVLLVWMILQFGGGAVAIFAEPQIPVHFVATRADGINDGSPVSFRGVNIGRVVHAKRTDDNKEVIIDATVDTRPPLPGNVVGLIRSVGLIGSGASIALDLSGAEAVGELKKNQEIKARFVGLDFLPPEFAELAKQLGDTARQIKESNLVKHLDDVVVKAGKTVDSLNQLVGDDKVQGDLKKAIADLRETMESAKTAAANVQGLTSDLKDVSVTANATLKKTQTHIDELSSQIGDRLLQIAKLMDTMQSITTKVNDGKGTMGMLVNDPRLYDGLVDTSRDLNATIKDLKRLVQQWEEEGASIKLR